MSNFTEQQACTPEALRNNGFNLKASIPYGLETEHVHSAMNDFLDFLGFINNQLNTKSLIRLEMMLMPANFSSIVGEFMTATMPKYCKEMAKNRYHNGHPDLIPTGMFAGNSVQHSDIGIEIKAS